MRSDATFGTYAVMCVPSASTVTAATRAPDGSRLALAAAMWMATPLSTNAASSGLITFRVILG
jgi:hypothetical protein